METKKEKKSKINMICRKTSNYPIGDFLIRIKNASLAGKKTVEFPSNRFVLSLARNLVKERFLEEVTDTGGLLKAVLSYMKKEPVITSIRLISKPGLRIYMKVEDLQELKGPSIYILSTPGGIMSSKEAMKKKLGGEVVAEIM